MNEPQNYMYPPKNDTQLKYLVGTFSHFSFILMSLTYCHQEVKVYVVNMYICYLRGNNSTGTIYFML